MKAPGRPEGHTGPSVVADSRSLGALGALDDVHHHDLSLVELGDAGPLQSGGMDKHVLAAFHRRDKAEALRRVVPLHRALHFDGRTGGRTATRRATGAATESTAISTTAETATITTAHRATRRATGTTSATAGRRRRGTLVDRKHLGHLPALLALADADAQRCARTDRGMAALIQGIGVEECVTGTVGQRHEAEPLLGVEPLDGCIMLWPEASG